MSNPERFLTEKVIDQIREIATHFTGEGPSQMTFVMSDIHGMAHFLEKIFIELKKEYHEPFAASFVFLGDYVDRGPYSAQVIAMIRHLQDLMPEGCVVALMGNHEEMLIGNYKFSGGLRNLYQITARSFKDEPIPTDVLEWLHNLPFRHEDELHYYVHAGFNPHYDMKDQHRSDMLWIRDEFLKSKKNWAKHVFHGHTPSLRLELKLNRSNVDTGACFKDGLLTCAIVEPNFKKAVWFLQVDDKKTYWVSNNMEKINV